MKWYFLLAFIIMQYQKPADKILGRWYTANNEAVVEVYFSGNGYNAKIISLKKPNDANGKPRKDSKNPDKNLRSRNLTGVLVFSNLKYSTKNNRWEGGRVYNPEMGHEADCIVYLIDENTLKVKGYIGAEFIGKSETWKRKNN